MATNGTDTNVLKTAWRTLRGIDAGNGHEVSEIIGRNTLGTAQASLYKSKSRTHNIDQTIPDYEFWDMFRRGKLEGYKLGSLFSLRIERIFSSWALGRGVEIKLNEGGDETNDNDPRVYTEEQLNEFINDNHAALMTTYRDMLGLGNQYIIVNVDGSLSIPSPDMVEVEYDEMDYRVMTAVEVTTKLEKVTIIDRYEADRRTVTVKERASNGRMSESVTTFPNLIGRLPVVHLAHDRSANETNGRSIHESLLPLFDQYDDTIHKQLDGAKLLGNPIPTFEGMEDINEVIADNDPAEYDTYTDKDGNTATRTQVNLDQNAIVFVGKGGSFKFTGPATGFTADTTQALKSLFLLILDHTGIPEFIWGNELSSSRSSAETQMTQFVRDIEGRQRNAEEWLLELCDIWLLTAALVDSRLVIDQLKAEWPPLIEEDEETKLKRLDFAKRHNLITDRTALQLLHLVDDVQQEVSRAQEEAEERREAMFPDGDTGMFNQRLNQDMNNEGNNQ